MKKMRKSESIEMTPYDYCRSHLFSYMQKHNLEVDPMYNYTGKFPMVLCSFFSDFIRDRDKRIFLLEAPPRTGKTSFLLRVVIPFIAGNNPNKRMMIITGSQQTKNTIIKTLAGMLKTKYFTDVFGGYGRLKVNQHRIELPNQFYIFITTTLSTVPTGDGFHFIVATDYIAGSMIDSKATMRTAMSSWEQYMTRKQSDPPTKIIVDNQRLSFYDLSHKISSETEKNGEKITRITMPYQFEEDRILKLPTGHSLLFKKGEFLIDTFNEREKKLILSTTSIQAFQTQYQQNPLINRGKIFNRSDFQYYNPEDLEGEFNRVFITTDFAFTQKDKSDYTVLCCWAEDLKNNLYLLDMVRGKVKGVYLDNMLYKFWFKWQNGLGNTPCSFITVEKVGQGNDRIINMIKRGYYLDDNGEKNYILCGTRELSRGGTNKYTRAEMCLSYYQQLKIFLPSGRMTIDGVNDVVNDIVEPFLREHEEFSEENERQNNDDIVDNCLDAVSVVNRARTSYAVEVSTV